jgi:hypothetical protein
MPPLVVIREDDWHECEPTMIAGGLVPLDVFSLCIPCRRVSVHVEGGLIAATSFREAVGVGFHDADIKAILAPV